MQQVIEFLQKAQVQYFATVGVDGKPKVRPFQFMLEDGGKLIFCTGGSKEVYREMQKTPSVEICSSGENFAWMRLRGDVVFLDDRALKEKVLDHSPLVKQIYQSADNPEFQVFALNEAVAVFYDFSGNPPRTVTL